MNSSSLSLLLACLVPLAAALPHLKADAAGPTAGQKVAFLGDSITQFGWESPSGYLHLVDLAFKQQGRPIVVIPAGISGNTSKDMLARLKRDVLDKKPDWMTLSCGVNDVWHGPTGVPLDEYKTNITSIVDQATAAGIKVVILTSTMIMEDQSGDFNQKLIPYNDFLRDLAKQRGLPLADLNVEMQAAVAKARKDTGSDAAVAGNHPTPNLLTVDGVHMNPIGNEMMAAGILKAFGFTPAQLAQARDLWLDMPNGMDLSPRDAISVRQYLQLRALAARQGLTVDKMVNDAFSDDVRKMLVDPSSVHKKHQTQQP